MGLKAGLEKAIIRRWYADPDKSLSAYLLSNTLQPLAKIFTAISVQRKRRLQKRYPTQDSQAVLVVIGNITVGGTGKTPLLMALANTLLKKGLSVAVIARGYGGQYSKQAAADSVIWVSRGADPAWVGDEPALIAEQLSIPIVIARHRKNAVEAILQRQHCDVILSDDGLQHYALARDIEIVVIDGQRGFGNARMLPAGPLREPLSRLQDVDAIVINGNHGLLDLAGSEALQEDELPKLKKQPCYTMTLGSSKITRLTDSCEREDSHQAVDQNYYQADSFQGITFHAVAGIGNPQRFFTSLSEQGIEFDAHSFSDHHDFVLSDLQFTDQNPIIMTAKDAIKCKALVARLAVEVYVFEVEEVLDDAFYQHVIQLIFEKKSQKVTG